MLAAATFAAASTGSCASTGTTNVGIDANSAAANTNRPVSNSNAVGTSTTASGSLATPTEAYRTAYDLREKKDIEGLKRVLSKDIQDFLTEVGKADNKSLDQMLAELVERPQGPFEVRSEKVEGDRAVIEYKDEKGQWKTMDFEKEGGDWKMTVPGPKSPRPDAPPATP